MSLWILQLLWHRLDIALALFHSQFSTIIYRTVKITTHRKRLSADAS